VTKTFQNLSEENGQQKLELLAEFQAEARYAGNVLSGARRPQ